MHSLCKYKKNKYNFYLFGILRSDIVEQYTGSFKAHDSYNRSLAQFPGWHGHRSSCAQAQVVKERQYLPVFLQASWAALLHEGEHWWGNDNFFQCSVSLISGSLCRGCQKVVSWSYFPLLRNFHLFMCLPWCFGGKLHEAAIKLLAWIPFKTECTGKFFLLIYNSIVLHVMGS